VRYLFALPGAEKQGNGLTSENADATELERKLTAAVRPVRPASVEAVFMPIESRQTICISTQAGCAVDCQFCMTAQLGLIRNLTAGEIVGQILVALRENEEKENTGERERNNKEGTEKSRDKRKTNVGLMGKGEPVV